MAVAMIGPKFYAWDRNGKPLAFGKLYTYQARTNVPKATYQSEDQVVENTNPVILNGEGYANVYLSGSYKMVLKDKDDNEIWSSDPVSSSEASEWVSCTSASYLSPESFGVFGNEVEKFEVGRKVRLNSSGTGYSYATIISSIFGSQETVVTLDLPIVSTSLVEACVSIVGPNSKTNEVLSFDSVSDLKSADLKEGALVRTKSYYNNSTEDTVGAASYRVVTLADFNGTPDNFVDHSLVNGNVAVLLLESDVLHVDKCGAVGDWQGASNSGTDNLAALQAVFDKAQQITDASAAKLGGAGGNQHQPTTIRFGTNKGYLISGPIIGVNHALNIVGNGRSTLAGIDFDDCLIKFSNNVYRYKIEGMTFQLTKAGALKFDGINVSSSRVMIKDCRFVTDYYNYDSGIAVEYRNRSSQLTIEKCYFNRVKHPVHNIECDWVSFYDCWFGYPNESVFEDKDGYIRNDSGFMRILNCLFAGGPSQTTPGGQPNGSEIAYVRVGTETPPIVAEYHPRLSIKDTRIGFEFGAGVLVNYFGDDLGEAGASFRSGIVLENIQTAPREDKLTAISGTEVGYLVRLFTMPHQLIFRDIHTVMGNAALIGVGSTTDLKTLRESIPSPIDYNDDIVDSGSGYRASYMFSVDNVTSINLFPIAEPTQPTIDEHSRWLELFGKYDYFFESNANSSQPTIVVDTWFDNFTETMGTLFEVFGGVKGSVSSSSTHDFVASGKIAVYLDKDPDVITPYYFSDIDYTQVPEQPKITCHFVVGGTEFDTINVAQAADAKLRIKIEHNVSPGVASVFCRGLVVRPVQATFNNNRINGLRQR